MTDTSIISTNAPVLKGCRDAVTAMQSSREESSESLQSARGPSLADFLTNNKSILNGTPLAQVECFGPGTNFKF